MEIGESLENSLSHLRSMDRLIADRARPGTALTKAILSSLGLACPNDLVSLYGLIDGFDMPADATIGEIAFFPGYYMLSIKEAHATYQSISANDQWNRAWLPVFASGGGDFYGVICEATSPDFGAVVGFLRDENGHIVEFASISALFETISRAYADGTFRMSNGRLHADYPRMRTIAQSVQPDFAEHDA